MAPPASRARTIKDVRSKQRSPYNRYQLAPETLAVAILPRRFVRLPRKLYRARDLNHPLTLVCKHTIWTHVFDYDDQHRTICAPKRGIMKIISANFKKRLAVCRGHYRRDGRHLCGTVRSPRALVRHQQMRTKANSSGSRTLRLRHRKRPSQHRRRWSEAGNTPPMWDRRFRPGSTGASPTSTPATPSTRACSG